VNDAYELASALRLLKHGPNRPEDELKVEAEADGVSGDDAADSRIFPESDFAGIPRGFDNTMIQWSNIMRMNLIKTLFSRHAHQGQASSSFPTYNWGGQSGKEYQFEIYGLDASFRPLPGVYIYAKQLSDGDWSPIYIAQTRDLHQRLEGHVTLQNAIADGATHLHAHYCNAGQGARCSEEKDLIGRWHPVCNDVFAG